jgi:phosphomannomutase
VGSVRIVSVSGLRGVVGNGLDPTTVAEFAAAYAAECPSGLLLVGHDGRRSAPMMVHAVLAGISASGRDSRLLGPVPTPTLGHLIVAGGAAGGVQVSASHNPAEYNGLKFFQPGGMVLSPAQGQAVAERFQRRDFAWVASDRLGQVIECGPIEPIHHVESIAGLVEVEAIRRARIKVVLDGGHGAGGPLGAELLRRLGCEVRLLGGTPDGFYEHPPEPTAENLRELAAVVPALGADVGFAQDPDADRLAIIDESGRYIGEERTLVLAALDALESGRRGPLVANLSTSRTIDDVAARFGCPVLRTPVGEIHVVEAMRSHGAILGGEGNGGVIDPRVVFVRDSLAGMAATLGLIARRQQRLSAIVEELPSYAMIKAKWSLTGVLPADRFEIAAAAFPEAWADRRDGLRLDWPSRWVHARASNTEPVVRIIAEAPTEPEARDLIDRLRPLVLPDT